MLKLFSEFQYSRPLHQGKTLKTKQKHFNKKKYLALKLLIKIPSYKPKLPFLHEWKISIKEKKTREVLVTINDGKGYLPWSQQFEEDACQEAA